MMKLGVCVVAILSLSISINAQEKWRFQELLDHALMHRNDLQAIDARIDKAHWQAREARSHFYPRLELKGYHQMMSEGADLDLSKSRIATTVDTTLPSMTLEIAGLMVDTGPIDVSVPLDVALPDQVHLMSDSYSQAMVQFRQPLYTGGRIRYSIEAAQSLGEVERANRAILEHEIASQIYRAFYSLVVLDQSQNFIERVKNDLTAFKNILNTLAETSDPEADGERWGLYFLEIDEFELTFQIMHADLEAQIQSALGWLSFASGLKKDLTLQDLELAALPLDSIWDWARLAQELGNHPKLKKIHRGIEATNALEKRERAGKKPTLGVEGFYYYYDDDLQAIPRDNAGIRVGLTMDVFNGGEVKARAGQQAARRRELEEMEQALTGYLDKECHQLCRDLVRAKQQMELENRRLKVFQERLDLALFGFKNGMAEFQDYRDAFLGKCKAMADHLARKQGFVETHAKLIEQLGMP